MVESQKAEHPAHPRLRVPDEELAAAVRQGLLGLEDRGQARAIQEPEPREVDLDAGRLLADHAGDCRRRSRGGRHVQLAAQDDQRPLGVDLDGEVADTWDKTVCHGTPRISRPRAEGSTAGVWGSRSKKETRGRRRDDREAPFEEVTPVEAPGVARGARSARTATDAVASSAGASAGTPLQPA
jgi:hypothetical protein